MGVLNRDGREIHAKIVYYGPQGAGMTANLRLILRKLKREHRGELQSTPVPDSEDEYEFLPVTLGTVRGYATSIHIYTVPGAPAHGKLRREILDGADGVVFVADLRPERHDATVKSARELKKHLRSHDLSFDDVVLVTQYNRRDESNENALDKLHKRLSLEPAASFEAVATEGTGVLQTLTTLSKLILSNIRNAADAQSEADDDEKTEDVDVVLDITPQGGGDFHIERAGPIESSDGELRIPIALVDDTGRTVELQLRMSLGAE